MTDEEVTLSHSLGAFNEYSVEIRSKIDGLVKQVLFLAGGIQAITVGAFLSGNPPRFPAGATQLLKVGWLSLSVSIVLCLLFMLGQILAMVAVGLVFKRKIEELREGAEMMVAPMPLRIFNWVVGLLAFLACASGTIALSLAAMRLISATGP